MSCVFQKLKFWLIIISKNSKFLNFNKNQTCLGKLELFDESVNEDVALDVDVDDDNEEHDEEKEVADEDNWWATVAATTADDGNESDIGATAVSDIGKCLFDDDETEATFPCDNDWLKCEGTDVIAASAPPCFRVVEIEDDDGCNNSLPPVPLNSLLFKLSLYRMASLRGM